MVYSLFKHAGLRYSPDQPFIVVGPGGTDDRWLEATMKITLENGELDDTHRRCIIADWDARLLLHWHDCARSDEFVEEMT